MESKTTLVSVIVPTRNSARVIERCLASIRNQSYPNIELIVVDNYSTDKTQAISRRYTDLVFEKGPERNMQRPYGVSQAKGEYLAFIDSDMELGPSIIESAVKKAEAGYDAVILPEVSAGEGFWAECHKLEKLCYLNDPYIEFANRFIKTGAYNAVGGYDQNIILGEDFDLHQKLVNKGFRIGRIENFINHHEEISFRKMVKKQYFYGRDAHKTLKKYPLGTIKYRFIRVAYLRNWKLFLKKPHYGLGLILMKLIQYTVAGFGLLATLIKRKNIMRAKPSLIR